MPSENDYCPHCRTDERSGSPHGPNCPRYFPPYTQGDDDDGVEAHQVTDETVAAVALLIDATRRALGREAQREAANNVIRLVLRDLGPAAEEYFKARA
jgi:transglutaminase-like putative cysteine protease